MFLNCPAQTLDVSFRVKHGEGHYMVYASTGSRKCFECGDVGHRGSWQRKQRGRAAESDQSQAAGPKMGGGEPCAMGSVASRDREDEMEYDTDSDCVSVADSQAYSGDLYAGGNKWLPK